LECLELDHGYSHGRYWIFSDWSGNEVLPVSTGGINEMLNTALMKNPLNWLTILLMLVIAGMAGHLLLSLVGIEPAIGDK
jgi:hypothetical protein